jgi:regulation of enolase protein 1 (concanavalin A-like superfamily)
LRIERKDDTVAGYASSDGNQWIEIGRLSISISRDLQVGLAVCSGLKNVTTVVKFDHVEELSTKGEIP